MLPHGGGTCKLVNFSQRQPESNLLLQPAKYNIDIFLSNLNEEGFFAEIPERKPCCFIWHSQSLPSPPKAFPWSAQSHPAQEINSE